MLSRESSLNVLVLACTALQLAMCISAQFTSPEFLPLFRQAQPPEEIEKIAGQTGDEQAVCIGHRLAAAHALKIEFISGLLDEILHKLSFAVQSDSNALLLRRMM